MISMPAFILFEDDPLTIATMEAYFAMMPIVSTNAANREAVYQRILELRAKRDEKIAMISKQESKPKECINPIACSRELYGCGGQDCSR